MTYAEYRVAVVDDILDQMSEHGWNRADATDCAGAVLTDYKAGKTPRQAANAALLDASRE